MAFHDYARYYDLLYRDKDYAGEADFVSALIERHAPEAERLLELGCGTGAHAALLAQRGFTVHGVDCSSEMLGQARKRLAGLPSDRASRLALSPGDIRTIRLDERFDGVIALFHVLSYETTNEDLRATFATARAHLKAGGIFLFDCWHGPTVLAEPAVVRVKRLENEEIAITRIAEPEMRPSENSVHVHYSMFVRDKGTGAIEEVRETHKMRYLFTPEIEELARGAGFHVAQSGEWMTDRETGLHTFGAYFVCKVSA